MLVEQGRISLDDKISRWLPNLLAADKVTVRMLVANTAGYIDYVRVQDFVNLGRRQRGQPSSGASEEISVPHFGQSLSALIIIGELLSPFLLRESLTEIMPGLHQLNGAHFGHESGPERFPGWSTADSHGLV